jgi:hypothetical protein
LVHSQETKITLISIVCDIYSLDKGVGITELCKIGRGFRKDCTYCLTYCQRVSKAKRKYRICMGRGCEALFGLNGEFQKRLRGGVGRGNKRGKILWFKAFKLF